MGDFKFQSGDIIVFGHTLEQKTKNNPLTREDSFDELIDITAQIFMRLRLFTFPPLESSQL